jgi:hypothetical protein
MTHFRQLLWVDGTIPVICAFPEVSYALVLNELRMFPRMLAQLEGGTLPDDVLHSIYLSLSDRPGMNLAQQLFWRTRIQPELVHRAQLTILLRKLNVNTVHLPDKSRILCSSTREELE